VSSLPGPIVGFYGVIDERIDFHLLESMATLRPDWSFVLVGPVVKIDERDIVHSPNIHYLGMRSYQELPRYLAAFDAAILPFARNDATRFISPTKTLEYLAGGKPVVSTPIKDVVDLYGDVVELASSAEEAVASIERLWGEPDTAKTARANRVHSLLAEHDWDVIAMQMGTLMNAAWRSRSSNPAFPTPASEAALSRTRAATAVREVAD